ncbi:Enkurin, partial [Ophiophagus hannah]
CEKEREIASFVQVGDIDQETWSYLEIGLDPKLAMWIVQIYEVMFEEWQLGSHFSLNHTVGILLGAFFPLTLLSRLRTVPSSSVLRPIRPPIVRYDSGSDIIKPVPVLHKCVTKQLFLGATKQWVCCCSCKTHSLNEEEFEYLRRKALEETGRVGGEGEKNRLEKNIFGTAMVMEESIYNLLPQIVEKSRITEKPSFVSAFRPYVKRAIQQSKSPWKTIGPPKVQVPSPKNFLQKHSKEPKLPTKKKDQHSKKAVELSVPKRTDHPIMGVQCTRNFINTNTSNAIMAVPKKPLPVYDYGVIPKYVIKRNEDTKKAQEEYDAYVRETLRQKAMKRLTEQERETLLESRQQGPFFLVIAFVTLTEVQQEKHIHQDPHERNTLPKKIYREKLETDMKQLEHDIQTIEKH